MNLTPQDCYYYDVLEALGELKAPDNLRNITNIAYSKNYSIAECVSTVKIFVSLQF